MRTRRGERVSGAAALMVFCIFAMLVFSVLMLGAGAYRNITGASRENSDERTCLSFIWTRVKNVENAGGVYVDDFYGTPALFIAETLGGTVYHTVIYHHDGWVYELFVEDVHGFSIGDGIRVVQVGSLWFEQQESAGITARSGDMSIFISTGLGSYERGAST